MDEYEERMRDYFYGGSGDIQISTIVEGGGRNQIKTYGEYLLQKKRKALSAEIVERCRVILKVIPDNYQRTLHTHFHRNFGLNLFDINAIALPIPVERPANTVKPSANSIFSVPMVI